MAGVKELHIMGIRSFAPDGDVAKVKFDKPLTLILGQNGCGKTTIIECLKYAITGEMPPGSNSGKSFIHDPKVNKSREVVGKVMLKVSDSKGDHITVSRNMQVTATAKGLGTFKTLDSSISRKNKNGQNVEVSSKCIETDETMCATLGVSKAILSNVIFCHQEDSNWPLDEGKKLKEKFDAIFDATRYNKCYEHIKKLIKQYQVDIKTLDAHVGYLRADKNTLDTERLRVATTQEKILNSETKLSEIRTNIVPIQKRRFEIEDIQKNFVEWDTKKRNTDDKLANRKSQQSELKNSIKIVFEGSIDELQHEIDSFTANMLKKKDQLQSLKTALEGLTNKEVKYMKDISEKKVKASELMTLEGQNQEKIDNRNKVLSETATLAGIDLDTQIETEDQAKTVQNQIIKLQKSKETELSEEKKKCNSEEKNLQSLVDQCRDAKARHTQKIVTKESELANFNDEKAKLSDKISDANRSKLKLDKIKSELDIAETLFTTVSSEMNTERCQAKIDDDELEIDRLEGEITKLDLQIIKLRKQNDKQIQIDQLKEAVLAKQKAFNTRKNKHAEAMKDVLGEVPTENFASKITSCETSIHREIQQLNTKLESKKHEITTLETERKIQKEQLTKLQQELSTAEEQISSVCRKKTLEEVLEKMDEDMEKLQEEKGKLSASLLVNKQYINEITSGIVNPCCPLCHRDFENSNDMTLVTEELEQKIRVIPEQLDRASEKLSRLSQQRDRLVGMKPLNEKIKNLKQIEIPALKSAFEKTDENLNKAMDEVDNLSMVISEPERKQKILKFLTADMPLLDDMLREIKTKTAEKTKLEAQIDPVGIDMTIDEAGAKEKELKTKMSELRTSNKNRQSEINTHNKKLQAAVAKRNSLKEEHLNIQAKVQEICSLEDRLTKVISELEKTKIQLNDLKKSTDLLDMELKNQEKIRETSVEKMRKKLDYQKDFISSIQKKYDNIMQLNKEIEAHERKNVRLELSSLKLSLEKISKEKIETTNQKEETATKLESFKEDLAKQELNKRGLDDNLRLKNLEMEQQNLEATLREIDSKLGQMNCSGLAKEKEKLINKESSLNMEKARTEGGLKELKENLSQHKQKVKEMSKVEDEYRAKFFEVTLLKAINKDLEQYSAALEYCLMQFHKERMERINFIIRDMWRSIYRGNDIDYIEIRTEPSTSTGKTRRTYDYRVVQCRNDVEIDMRGRCSAGQKVLACLIIRMALAETFSTKFGVLALDEPTTNLDRENIVSLCSALSQIVTARMQQANFMFIIITHDLEFLTALARVDKLTYYHEVTRNKDGKSVIAKVPMK